MAQIESNLHETVRRFEQMQISGGEMEKTLHELVGNVIKEARMRIVTDASGVIGTGYKYSGGDPRQAYRAIKHMVYKSVLGGNVSILSKKRAGSMRLVAPQRRLRQGQRGGNRVKRSARTEKLMSYWGADRGFVLRFLNGGTGGRVTRLGWRGSISARNWFAGAGQKEMAAASKELAELIEKEIEKFNNR